MRLKMIVAAIVSVGLTLVALPRASAEEIPPEVGGGHVGVSFGNFRFPGTGCYYHTGYLNVAANDDAAYEDFWVELDLTVTRDGEIVDGWFDFKDYSGRYSLKTQLCRGYSRTGSYTVSGTVTFWDYDYNSYEVPVSDTFTVYPPHTASVSVSKDRWRAHGWKVNGLAKYDGKAWANKRIYFQVKRSGSWRTISSKTANSRGRAAFYYTPPRGKAKPYRLLTKASSGVGNKTSGTFYLRRR